MKKLINKKTGEIAYINLYFNTITFSKSKTTHKISIQKDPNTNQITKITSSPDPIPNPDPIPEPISEPTPEPIINNNSSEPSNTSTPNTNNSPSESINTTTSNINTHKSQSSNTNKNKHKSPNKTLNNHHNNSELMDEFLIYEMYPETEIFDPVNPRNHAFPIPTYKITA